MNYTRLNAKKEKKMNTQHLSLFMIIATLTNALSAHASEVAFSGNNQMTNPPAFAFEDVPGKTKYDILLDAYNSATTPATLSDFPDFEKVKNLKVGNCTAVWKSSPDELFETFARTGKITLPGEPSHGPLFPGAPDQVIEKLMILSGGNQSLQDDIIKAFNNSKTETDLVVSVSKNDLTVWVDLDLPARASFRKKDNYMPFIAQTTDEKGNVIDTVLVGYCY